MLQNSLMTFMTLFNQKEKFKILIFCKMTTSVPKSLVRGIGEKNANLEFKIAAFAPKNTRTHISCRD